MSASLILRFSDFGFDSIREHQGILLDSGYVYWGWWKKNGLDLDLETDLLAISVPLLAGAFSRSRPDTFYIFRLAAISCEPSGTPLPSPEPERTPEYYRSKSCAAWFRIDEMRPVTEADFIKNFGPVPVGERTLFIRTDLKAEDIGQVPSVETDANVVLHLSDIHFGEDFGYPDRSGLGDYSLVDRLTTDVQKLNVSVGLVIISGDLLT